MRKLLCLIACLGLSACQPAGSSDYHFNLQGGYYVYRTSAHQIGIMSRDGARGISPKVIEVGWDHRFIVVRQQELHGTSYQEPVDGIFRFWIIAIPERNLVGPLTEQDFLEAKEKMGVAADVVLRPTDSYVK